MPEKFRSLNDKLNVDRRITQFILPIACHINYDGTALFVAVGAVFMSQMSGKVLGPSEFLTIALVTTFIPSGGVIRVMLILSAMDVPTHNITLLLTIDWLV